MKNNILQKLKLIAVKYPADLTQKGKVSRVSMNDRIGRLPLKKR